MSFLCSKLTRSEFKIFKREDIAASNGVIGQEQDSFGGWLYCESLNGRQPDEFIIFNQALTELTVEEFASQVKKLWLIRSPLMLQIPVAIDTMEQLTYH